MHMLACTSEIEDLFFIYSFSIVSMSLLASAARQQGSLTKIKEPSKHKMLRHVAHSIMHGLKELRANSRIHKNVINRASALAGKEGVSVSDLVVVEHDWDSMSELFYCPIENDRVGKREVKTTLDFFHAHAWPH